MDNYAKSNLELTESVRTKKRQGSLLAFLNKTETAMGFRLLKNWLDRPLISLPAIERRQSQIEDLIEHYFQRLEIKDLRSEEHTSELQSRFDLVCRLLLE